MVNLYYFKDFVHLGLNLVLGYLAVLKAEGHIVPDRHVGENGVVLEYHAHISLIGGDVVGMSVVPEVISARHCDLKVVAVSAITNMAEGLSDVKLSHAQTLAAAELSKQNFINLICGFLRKIA